MRKRILILTLNWGSVKWSTTIDVASSFTIDEASDIALDELGSSELDYWNLSADTGEWENLFWEEENKNPVCTIKLVNMDERSRNHGYFRKQWFRNMYWCYVRGNYQTGSPLRGNDRRNGRNWNILFFRV